MISEKRLIEVQGPHGVECDLVDVIVMRLCKCLKFSTLLFPKAKKSTERRKLDRLQFTNFTSPVSNVPFFFSSFHASGELFSIKDPVKVCYPRVDTRLNWNAKEFVSTEEHNIAEKPLKKPTNQRKVQCKGARCSNQPKRGCDFDMCARCCKKVAEPCSVHEDAFSVFEPPVFERNYSFFKIEPKALFRFAQRKLVYLYSVSAIGLRVHLG